ncbi:hypothetical protein C7B65_16535 [Phormidesmis priestleyi ULC007]|uniref:Uncharacterized protein n=1 Tax=Phormidesmis priestleyi ULC007 TaxID=1920490 RepID=A0A2T1DCG2_9CYAN|nr:hypothetical protein [Phormidesmis priestleyi]PSB18121.1 hypothetical protein C7B65_16535 [Phormidesmis priestleyi ULC007]PZO49609.1 MAG: hypothetical protein DCF14_13695 [Phormidesmis priestleyi]
MWLSYRHHNTTHGFYNCDLGTQALTATCAGVAVSRQGIGYREFFNRLQSSPQLLELRWFDRRNPEMMFADSEDYPL